MTKEEAKSLLIERVNSLQGIKAVELVSIKDGLLELMEFNISELLEELVREAKIIEIEYFLPQYDFTGLVGHHRAKSFYLPINTIVSKISNV